MPTTRSLETLIKRARAYYGVHGYLPMDLTAHLVDAGCIVSQLEQQWDHELINGEAQW